MPRLLLLSLLSFPKPVNPADSSCACVCVCVQGGRRDEDHEYGEAAQDDPDYSEPDGRPPGFQCESKGEASHRASLSLGSRARVRDSQTQLSEFRLCRKEAV